MAEAPSNAHLVVDGSNIATEGRSLPSLRQLDEAVRALLKERPHETWTVVVDATFGHRIDSSEKQMYEEALAANELVTPPAGTIGRGDKFLLEVADRANATVFSNDSFQEFHGEYEWLFDDGRLIGGKPVPEVGWIFTARTPVRGPRSRMSSRAASERRGRAGSGTRRSRRVLSATEPLPVPSKPPPRSRRTPVSAASAATPSSTDDAPEPGGEAQATPTRSGRGTRGRRSGTSGTSGTSGGSGGSVGSVEPVNDPLPFIEFIAEHSPGSVVEGEVTAFTSHGAFVQVGDVRCYLALKLMGDPAPRSARDVLNRGEVRDFVVHALDAPRRGIDLALSGVTAPAEEQPSADPVADVPPRRPRRARRAPDPAEAPVVAPVEPDEGLATGGEPDAGRPSTVAKRKATTKKAAVKKKATTKKAAARKKATTKKKAAAKKAAPAETTTEPTEEQAGTGTDVAPAALGGDQGVVAAPAPGEAGDFAPPSAPKKASTRKAPAKRTPAKKAATKKATTKKKATAKSSATKRKAPAKKAEATTAEPGAGEGTGPVPPPEEPPSS